MEYQDSCPRSTNSMKNLIITLQNYKQDKSETSLSDTMHHIEILHAIFTNTPDEIAVCFGKNDNVGLECLSSVIDVLSWQYVDHHLLKKMISLLVFIGKNINVINNCNNIVLIPWAGLIL